MVQSSCNSNCPNIQTTYSLPLQEGFAARLTVMPTYDLAAPSLKIKVALADEIEFALLDSNGKELNKQKVWVKAGQQQVVLSWPESVAAVRMDPNCAYLDPNLIDNECRVTFDVD
ncbi:MAG: hypothetical protein KDC71_09030 [Acidobacteria bacterium]|nr:hypothetical protein [Acidobacteriota bacterium]